MGRIAEAMKKAQAERIETIRLSGGTTERIPASIICPPPEMGPLPKSDIAPGAAAAADQAEPDGAALQSVSDSIVTLRDPASAIAEQYRGLRTWLLRHNTTGEHRSIAITSSLPNEGKSVTAMNLAITIAEVKHLSVLALDADLRHGMLAKLLGRPAGPGLSDVLTGGAALNEAIHPTGIRNLSILPAGHLKPTSSAELFSTRTTAALFDEVRERFHYVIVDTAAVQSAADVGAIGGLCSGLLMVIRMNSTPEPIARQSARWLQANNLNLLGCVLTSADSRGRTRLHPFGAHTSLS